MGEVGEWGWSLSNEVSDFGVKERGFWDDSGGHRNADLLHISKTSSRKAGKAHMKTILEEEKSV